MATIRGRTCLGLGARVNSPGAAATTILRTVIRHYGAWKRCEPSNGRAKKQVPLRRGAPPSVREGAKELPGTLPSSEEQARIYAADPEVCRSWREEAPGHVRILEGDTLDMLEATVKAQPGPTLVYCDPPYLHHTRRSSKRYRYEFTEQDHARFLDIVRGLPCMVMVSHLPCVEYSTALSHWHTFTFENVTRQGFQTEQVWTNYTPTPHLHDYAYVGSNFRERERIKRQMEIVLRRFNALPPSARIALQSMVQAADRDDQS